MEFKVGDKVKINSLKSIFHGHIGELTNVHNSGWYDVQFGMDEHFSTCEPEKLELVEKDVPIRKFKVGDKVRITENIITVLFPDYSRLATIIDTCDFNGKTAYHIKFDGSERLHFVYEDQIEKVEETNPEPKIDMVVKCISACGGLIKGAYYKVKSLHKNCCLIEGIEGLFNIDLFTTFKVGDRFRRFDNDSIVIITKFVIEKDGNILVHYSRMPELLFKETYAIEVFNNLYPFKLEDEEKNTPELQVGDYVEILTINNSSYGRYGYITHFLENTDLYAIVCQNTNTLGFLGAFELKYLKKVDKPKEEIKLLPVGTRVRVIAEGAFADYRIGKLGTIVELHENNVILLVYRVHMDGDDKYYTLWMDADNLEKLEEPKPKFQIGQKIIYNDYNCIVIGYDVKNNAYVISKYDIDIYGVQEDELRVGKSPKPEWQPKFKVGDWVQIIHSIYKDIVQIAYIDLKDKSYKINYLNGKSGDQVYFDHEFEIWQPIQELQKRNETQARSIKSLLAEVKDLKDQIEKKNELEKALREQIRNMFKIMEDWAEH